MKSVKDPDKMSQTFRDMPGSFPMLSMLLGTLAITMFSFGYFELCNWMREFSGTASVIMYISTIIYLVPIVTHHVFCGAAEWIYIRFGRTNEATNGLPFKALTSLTKRNPDSVPINLTKSSYHELAIAGRFVTIRILQA